MEVGVVWVIAATMLGGCAAQVQQQQEDEASDSRRLPIPSVKVPLISYPLSNRRCSDNLLERLLPEPDHNTPGRNW